LIWYLLRELASVRQRACGEANLVSSHDRAPTGTDTLSLHDALPISPGEQNGLRYRPRPRQQRLVHAPGRTAFRGLLPGLVDAERSEEHTSELQSRGHLVCRLLPEKKKL